MPSKSRRSRRQRRSTADTSGGPQAAASSTRPRSERRAASRKARSDGSLTRYIVAGAIIVVVALMGVGIYQFATGAGVASNFDFRVYQGEEALGGSTVKFSSLLGGGQPVVLNFWGGDCPPCRAEMPALQRVYDAHKDEMLLVGLDVGRFLGLGTQREALALLEELDISYPAGTPPNAAPLNNYAINGLPATVFFGRDGEVARIWSGAIREDQMESIVSGLLEGS